MKQTLSDDDCDFVISEMKKAHGFENITRKRVRMAYQEARIRGSVTSQYSLFVLGNYFEMHQPDPVSLLGDVVRDDV